MDADGDLSGDTLDAVSRELVRITRELYGKGPEQAKAFHNDQFIFCVLKGGLTTIEQSLVGMEDQRLVRQLRLHFQEQMRDRFTEAVERITGRRVAAYESQVIFDPDYVVEIFILEPVASA